MIDSSPATAPDLERQRTWPRSAFLIPVVLFLVINVALGWRLTRNPREFPSALIGKPVPDFDLSPVQRRTLGFSTADLRGQVSLVNVFASWCTACRAEHPLFMQLSRSGAVPIHGLNYKDRPADAAEWLDTLGDLNMRTGADLDGRVGIEWGVYGVPETFVVSANGTIAYKHIGPVTPEAINETVLTLVEQLRSTGQGSQP